MMYPILEQLQVATKAYDQRIDADYASGRFLADGAGQRLDEKPEKNWKTRIPSIILYCNNGEVGKAESAVKVLIATWRDHVGLLTKYWKTEQMTFTHVYDYLDTNIYLDYFPLPQSEIKSSILLDMEYTPYIGTVEPNGWSIGVAQYDLLNNGACR